MRGFRLLSASMPALALLAILAAPARTADAKQDAAIFAGGCFWCVEADFDKLEGVISTTSGYIGGSAETAHYKIVSGGGTGHYEAVKIVYDPARVSYEKLLYHFWRTIDPTDDGGQFCDRGDSYKTGIFVLNDEQQRLAEESKQKLQEDDVLKKPVVTKIVKASRFYPAEDYHQNYYKKNPVRYKIYRYGCARDARIEALWGDQAHGLKH